MQLQNIQQQIIEHVKVHYEWLLKLTNCLQVKVIDVFFTIVFRISLLPYFKLTTIGMKWNTLIEHKEVVVCEESGHVSLSYNVLLTPLEVNVVTKPIVTIVKGKSTYTYINCGRTCHTFETCHN
jgi:hypothetical protein